MTYATRTATALLALLFACGSGDEDGTGGGDGEGDSVGADGGYTGDPIDDAQDFCSLMADAVCGKLMTCFTAAERSANGMPATEAECLDQQSDCSPDNVCDSGQSYDATSAGACVAEYQSSSCEDVRSPSFEPGPACSAVCQ
jgi:hypothetical protein